MRSLVGSIATVVRNSAPVAYTGRSGMTGSIERKSGAVADMAYEAMGSVGTLYAIISMITHAVASTEWELYKKSSGNRDKALRKSVQNSAVMDLWNRPNPFFTGYQLRQSVQQHLDLIGEGCILLVRGGPLGTIYEMWPVRPDRVHPVKHPTQFLTGYIYLGPDGEEVPIAREDMLHLKYPNPADPYRGLGPVQSALLDLESAKNAALWNLNFFRNGARPGGIIEVDYRMGDEEWREFNARWAEQHKGVNNAHRVAVLENAKWTEVATTMQDMQFVEMRDLSRELVREAFAFPKPMLGSVDDVNRANGEVGEEIFGRWLTLPRLRLWREVLNYCLLPQFVGGEKQEMDFLDPIPTSPSTENAIRQSQTGATKTLVDAGFDGNDARIAMGLPEMRWNPKAVAAAPQGPNQTDAPSERESEQAPETDPASSQYTYPYGNKRDRDGAPLNKFDFNGSKYAMIDV
jgi:HK97 family phage portal protein